MVLNEVKVVFTKEKIHANKWYGGFPFNKTYKQQIRNKCLLFESNENNMKIT